MNHSVVDGSPFWQFFNTFSEIFKSKNEQAHRVGSGERRMYAALTSSQRDRETVSERPPAVPRMNSSPVHKRWFPEGHGPIVSLPYTHHDQFTSRPEVPQMRTRFFHFSKQSLQKLKEKANQECNTSKISSLQALSAHMWKCITKARNFTANNQVMTSCSMAINNRARIEPALPETYFGNCVQTVRAIATAGEVLDHGLGWAAWKLHEAVVNHKNGLIREWVDKLESAGMVYQLSFFEPYSVMMGSSPRFNMYGNEFGLGKAVAVRSGYANKFDGKISLYPGIEGDGSMDLEVCLLPQFMATLESDKQFLESLGAER